MLGHQFYLRKNELSNSKMIILIKLIIQNIDEIKKSYQKKSILLKSQILKI